MIIRVEDLGRGVLKDSDGQLYYSIDEGIIESESGDEKYHIVEYDNYDNVTAIEKISTIRISSNDSCYLQKDEEMAQVCLTTALINACLRHIHERGCNEISYDDYHRIIDNAAFLVSSYQVTEVEDIKLDSILECFNDTEMDRKYL